MAKCPLCNQKLGRITQTHLWHKHKMRFVDFMSKFPGVNTGPMPWKKGETKATNPSLLRLSKTLKTKKEWNFSKWRKEKKNHRKVEYKELQKDNDLAELLGIVLGDSNLYKHSRTENLRVICNSKDTDYIQHIADLVKKVFQKTPSVIKRKNENATDVCLYQCKISKRLNLPCGNKIKNNVGIPRWIFLNEGYMWKCLKGLFETDGCFHEDKENYTRCMEFKNNCMRLKKDTYNVLLKLGFNPQLGSNYVRLARKSEAYRFKELIDFRNYS